MGTQREQVEQNASNMQSVSRSGNSAGETFTSEMPEAEQKEDIQTANQRKNLSHGEPEKGDSWCLWL